MKTNLKPNSKIKMSLGADILYCEDFEGSVCCSQNEILKSLLIITINEENSVDISNNQMGYNHQNYFDDYFFLDEEGDNLLSELDLDAIVNNHI